MNIDMELIKSAFEILLFGWTGVFLVMFILYLTSLALLKVFPKKEG